MKLMKCVMEELLIKPDPDTVYGVFEKVSRVDKLQTLREGLRLFMRHFLLSRIKNEKLKTQLKKRIKVAESAMEINANTVM